MAAELNFNAGAAKNGTAISAVNQAVLILGKYKFDGVAHTKISAAASTIMNNLATTLDNYNNNRPNKRRHQGYPSRGFPDSRCSMARRLASEDCVSGCCEPSICSRSASACS
jgi:hypothetical protein